MQDYIRICDVEKYYGNASNVTKAVDRVSFGVDRGEFVGVMGASGSGKTTLLNMLATIDRVTSGHIYYGNIDITELSENALSDFRRDNLGFVFQEYNLLDTLTIEENILLALTLQGGAKSSGKKAIQARCDDILRLLGIEEIRGKFPYQVSGGQKQRCACARALVNRPKLLLADEPTGEPDAQFVTQRQDNGVLLIFEDNGIGIRREELARIFEKGFTGSNGRDNQRSTGMGLYLCRKLCDKLGIGLSAASEYGAGTRICLEFPLSTHIVDVR